MDAKDNPGPFPWRDTAFRPPPYRSMIQPASARPLPSTPSASIWTIYVFAPFPLGFSSVTRSDR